MEVTLIAAFIALQIGPLTALLFALPYTVYSYIRSKSVDVLKCTYVYTFCLYSLCAYFVTWLPLPSAETLANLKPMSEFIQLVPFQSFMDIELETVFRDLAIIIFNVVLTMPLGYFLRELFHVSLKKTVLAGFLVSLLYEVTQLTGLFFIYPRAYRIFDVDDLIINTLGAYLGYQIAPLLSRLLPGMSDTKTQRLMQGSEVAFMQRAVAGAVDTLAVLLLTVQAFIWLPPLRAVAAEGTALLRFPLFFAVFMLLMALYCLAFGSGTPGWRLTNLRLVTAQGKATGRVRTALRALVLHVCVSFIPFWIFFFMSITTEYAGVKSILWVLIGALLMMCEARIVLEIMFNAVTRGSSMFYDRLMKTHVVYGNSRKTSLLGVRVLDIRPLEPANVDILSGELFDTLCASGVSRSAATKVRLMAEGVLLDWIGAGLGRLPCELRLSRRFRRRMLMLSVPGTGETQAGEEESYVEMLSGMALTLETYRAAEKSVCIIHIP